MPKLKAKEAAAVEKEDAWGVGSGRVLLDPGRYAAQLFSCEERVGTGPGAQPYWNWRFVNIHDESGDMQGRSNQFLATSLSPKARGRLKQVFQAFGYTADSDTEELVGEWVVLHIDQEIQERGKNAGQQTNVVRGVAPFDPEDWPFNPETVEPYTERERTGGNRVDPWAGGGDDDQF